MRRCPAASATRPDPTGPAEGTPFDTHRGVTPLLTDDTLGSVWLAEPDAGYVVVACSWSVEIGGPEAVLDEVYVRDRGRGTGARLVAAAEASCRAHGMRRIFLETEAVNDAARRLYARLGFTADDSIWMAQVLAQPAEPGTG